jgi:hypothetical protein
MRLTIHIQLVPRTRIHGFIYPFPPYALMQKYLTSYSQGKKGERKSDNTAVEILHANHVAPSIR